MKRRERRTFSQDFKHQMVQLYLSGKPASDNLTQDQIELIKSQKRIKELEMENDICPKG